MRTSSDLYVTHLHVKGPLAFVVDEIVLHDAEEDDG